MKLFYITTPEIARTLHREWHGFDLGNGHLIICAEFFREHEEFNWANTEGVMSLPHPIHQSTHLLAEEHCKLLSGKYKIAHGHNIHDLIQQVSKDDLWMRLHVL